MPEDRGLPVRRTSSPTGMRRRRIADVEGADGRHDGRGVPLRSVLCVLPPRPRELLRSRTTMPRCGQRQIPRASRKRCRIAGLGLHRQVQRAQCSESGMGACGTLDIRPAQSASSRQLKAGIRVLNVGPLSWRAQSVPRPQSVAGQMHPCKMLGRTASNT
jgi:hypothetical protein